MKNLQKELKETDQLCVPLGHHDELHATPAKLSKTETTSKPPHSTTPCSLEIHSPTITPSVVTVRALVKTGLNEGNQKLLRNSRKGVSFHI